MKRKLLSLLLLAVVGGTNSAWADEHNFTLRPTQEKQFRLNNDLASFIGTPKDGMTTSGKLECTWTAKMAVMQEYEFSADINWNKVQSVTIVVKYENNRPNFWASSLAFPSDFTAANADAVVYDAIGIHFDGTIGDAKSPIIADVPSLSDYFRTSVISGDKLTTLKTLLRDGTDGKKLLTLVATRESLANGKAEFYSSASSNIDGNDYRPVMYVDYYPVYNATTNTGYDNLQAAFAATATAATTLELWRDCIVGSARATWAQSFDLNIVPMTNVTIKRGSNILSNAMILWNKTQTYNIGSDTYTLTFDGEANTFNNNIFASENGTANIKNIKFKDCNLSASGVLIGNKGGTTNIKNLTVTDCSVASTGVFISQRNANNAVMLDGAINFENCTGTHIKLNGGRLMVANGGEFSVSTPILLQPWTDALNTLVVNVAKGSSDADCNKFIIVCDGDNRGLVRGGSGHTNELLLAEAYTLPVTAAEASTLVLPFEATIPAGLTCYNLSYSGGNNISAETVESPLAADKAVLVKGDEGSYKFVKTSTAATDAPSGRTEANGVLVGNYDADYYAPADSYVLQNQTEYGLGFYRVASENPKVVKPYRAYMDVTYAPAAHDFFNIDFDGNGTTGISDMKCETVGNNRYFDLQGRSVAQPTKGLYIVNGKKMYVK